MWTSSRHFKFNLPKTKLLITLTLKLLCSRYPPLLKYSVFLLGVTFKVYLALHCFHCRPSHCHLLAELVPLFSLFLLLCPYSQLSFSNQSKRFKFWHIKEKRREEKRREEKRRKEKKRKEKKRKEKKRKERKNHPIPSPWSTRYHTTSSLECPFEPTFLWPP